MFIRFLTQADHADVEVATNGDVAIASYVCVASSQRAREADSSRG